jgi:ferredoxin
MAHHTSKDSYRELMQRVNKFPQGAPPSELLFKIFAILFTEEDASLLSKLPLRPFSAANAAKIWQVPEHKARNMLDSFASRAMLLDLERDDKILYVLPPPMAGFFEFSLMRLRPEIDQHELATLFYKYINVDDAFVKDLFDSGETQLGRVLVHEPALPDDFAEVLDYERASEIIRTAKAIAVGLCYCRHKMQHVGKACEAPLDICMTLNAAAQSLIKHGIARSVDAAEGLDLLQQARELNLVQCADNVQREVNFICHCCGCCCEAMLAIKRLGLTNAMYTTNFIQQTDASTCIGCGKCVNLCPVNAIALTDARGLAPQVPVPLSEGRNKQKPDDGRGLAPNVEAPVAGSGDGRGMAPQVPVRLDDSTPERESVDRLTPSTRSPLPLREGDRGWGKQPRSTAQHPEDRPARKTAILDETICLGCGVCVPNCPSGAIRLKPRDQRILTPVNTAHRLVLMAIERGKLQNLVFDNQAYLSHRVMAAILGAILRLPPVKRVLASRQLKSRYLERLISDVAIDQFSK